MAIDVKTQPSMTSVNVGGYQKKINATGISIFCTETVYATFT